MSSIVGADRARSSSARTRLNDGRLAALLVSTALTAPLALGVSQGWAQVAASGDVSPSPAVSPVWTTPSLLVGNTGSGSVTITAGGQVSSDMGNIGSAAGSSGRVSVDGAGTTWTNTDLLIVGDEGDGTLSVTSGALVSSSSIYMAAREDASGAVTVDAGRLSLAGLLTVGLEGRAAVTILNGGEVSNQFGVVGGGVGSASTATVDGAGSRWTQTGDFILGYQGIGGLTISNGGQVSNTNGVIGVQAGSTGSASVDGAGSTWTSSGALVVGGAGDGALTISNGGQVSSDGGFVAADGGHGEVTVAGSGSTWTIADVLDIGTTGPGTLTITDGGQVSNDQGSLTNGDVLVRGAGSAWNNTGTLFIASSGPGGGPQTATLTVSDGGVVSSSQGAIGLTSGATGAVVLDSAGSKWSLSDRLFVGMRGQGILSIMGGSAVDADDVTIIGIEGGSGLVSVDGPGSTLTSVQDVFVAEAGDGALTITNGAAVVNRDGVLGLQADAHGVATVSGAGSSWTSAGELIVGYLGEGRLSIADGGRVVSARGEIAYETGSTGAVTVDGAGSAWEVGSLVVGGLGDGVLTVSNGGVVSVDAGAGFLDLDYNGGRGVLNIGAKAGAAAAASGDLAASAVVFRLGSGEINFNHTNPAYTFAANIVGEGAINQWAGRTILTGNSSDFGGVTTVSGGVLAVNGKLGGALSVLAGGQLQGSGTVGTLAVAGTVAPGNSIGTLTVNGAFSQAAGSTYQFELTTAGLSDRINVAGKATIASGATLNIVKTDAAAYVPGVRYTVLTATDGVTGTYTLTGDLGLGYFTGLGAAYDSNAVYLEVVKARTFSSTGLSSNQIGVGAGLDSLALTSPLAAALLALPDGATARGAFDQLSGTSQVSTKAVLVEDSRFPREAAVNRLRSAFGDVGAAPAPAIAPQGVTVWGDAFGSRGTFDGDANASTLDRDLGGLIFGVDASAFGGWRVGLLGGYSHSKYKAHDHRQAGTSDDYHLGLYGGRQWGPIALRTSAAFSWHELDARRTVAFPGFTDALESDNSAFTAQAFGEVGYRLDLGRRAAATVSLEPFANLAYVNLDAEGFAEKGGAAALSTQSDNTGAAFTTLGLRAASTFDLDNDRTVTARGALGWKHAFGDLTPTSTVAFSGGSAFAVAGLPIDKDAVVVEAGLDAGVSSTARFSLSYGAQFAGKSTDQTVRGGFSVKF